MKSVTIFLIGLVFLSVDLAAKSLDIDKQNLLVVNNSKPKKKGSTKKETSEIKKEDRVADNVNVKANSDSGSGWSNYQNTMTWEEAKAKCLSLGMKLPSIEELKAAYSAQITESWKDSPGYWSSTPVGNDRAYEILISLGLKHDSPIAIKSGVRCLR